MEKYIFYNSTYDGNLKSMYENLSYDSNSKQLYWLVDSPKMILGFPKDVRVLVRGESRADFIIKSATFLFEDKFHMTYPSKLSRSTPIVNLWHGVGLKNVELNSPINGILSERIMKRYIHSSYVYRQQTYFVSTSTYMTEHFQKSMILDYNKFIEVGMPRLDLANRKIIKLSNYDTILWAPTFRDTGDFETILPLNKIKPLIETLSSKNLFMIFSPHPNMRNDSKFKQFLKLTKNSGNIKVMKENEDVYDYLSDIKYSVVDYSSIFYDLVYLGFDKFIRYIPDYEKYSQTQIEFQNSYFSDTYGLVVRTIDQLISVLGDVTESELVNHEQKKLILRKYFNQQTIHPTQSIIEKISEIKKSTPYNTCGLYSFNAHDVVPSKIFELSEMNKVIILHFNRIEKRINIKNTPEFFIELGETIDDFYKRIFYIELKKYKFDFWRHYGSNQTNDDVIPRKYGIQTGSYLSVMNQKKRISLLQVFSPKRLGDYKDDRFFENSLSNTPKILRNLIDLKITIIKWLYWRNRP